eukprot:6004431-Pyramimonas_sp.AAC.1
MGGAVTRVTRRNAALPADEDNHISKLGLSITGGAILLSVWCEPIKTLHISATHELTKGLIEQVGDPGRCDRRPQDGALRRPAPAALVRGFLHNRLPHLRRRAGAHPPKTPTGHPPDTLRTPGILNVHNVDNWRFGLLCPSHTVQHTLKMPL